VIQKLKKKNTKTCDVYLLFGDVFYSHVGDAFMGHGVVTYGMSQYTMQSYSWSRLKKGNLCEGSELFSMMRHMACFGVREFGRSDRLAQHVL
jgi:hypothetical protein